MTRPEHLDVTVIVVAYNDQGSLSSCIGALIADAAPAQIIVVDNASDDGTASILSDIGTSDERIRIQQNRENIGYAAAVTNALPLSSSAYIAVLNADTVPSAGWLDPQIDYLEQNTHVAATSPTLVLRGTDLLNATGLDIHITGVVFNRNLHHPISDAATSPERVPGIQGTAFVIRRSALEAMGGWYSAGFLYHEEAELSWTLRLMGHDIVYVPTPAVEHNYVLTMSPEKLFLLERNRWEMLLANTKSTTLLVLGFPLLWTEAMVWAYCLMQGPRMLRAKWRSYASIRSRRTIIQQRRAHITDLRRVSDRSVLHSFRWNYAWGQMVSIGRRRSTSGRRGGRDLPVR